MKKSLIFLSLLFITYSSFSQIKNDSILSKTPVDSLSTVIVSIGFLSSGSGQYIGGVFSIDQMAGFFGIYGNYLVQMHKDTIAETAPSYYSGGFTFKLVKNFLIYTGLGFCKNVPEGKNSKIGFDFGAIYFTGSKRLKMGIMVGYNTLMEIPLIGFRFGVGTYKSTPKSQKNQINYFD
jgi:hypothetical protein